MTERVQPDSNGEPIRTFEYDVLLKNLRDENYLLYEVLLLAAEHVSTTIAEKQAFINGFLHNYGLRTEDEKSALLERIFSISPDGPIDASDDGDLPRSGEPGDDQPTE